MKVFWNKYQVVLKLITSAKTWRCDRFYANVITRSINVDSASSKQNTKNRDGDANEMVQKFLEEKQERIEYFNKEFGYPYVDVNKYKLGCLSYEPSESALCNFYMLGHIHKPVINIKYILENTKETENNIHERKTENINIDKVIGMYHRLQKIKTEMEKYQSIVDAHNNIKLDHASEALNAKYILTVLSWLYRDVEKLYMSKALSLPNQTSPKTPDSRSEGLLEVVGKKPEFDFEVYNHETIGRKMKILRQERMSRMAGHRNYFLYGAGAELEQALVQFTLDRLREKNFIFISTPNVLKDAVFEGAGLVSRNMNKMVYSIGNNAEENFHLAGTSELGLCAYFSSHAVRWKNLPIKACSVSTCYRKETATRYDRAGIFRVHQFLKVEMFGVTANETGNESNELHEEFVEIQKELFQELGLHFEVIDMPASDLGLPAYRKIDIEAWFPGRNEYGEISSASNCTDYQSRRLHILYKNNNDNYKFAHTVNATACAVPRMIIALLENGQQYNRTVKLPSCLDQYMNGRTKLYKDAGAFMEYIGIEQSKKKQISLSDD